MRKVISVVLMLSMLLTMITPTLAATVADETSYAPAVMEYDLSGYLKVGVKAEDSEEYVYPPSSLSINLPESEEKVLDYKAILDMSMIRELASKNYVTSVGGTKEFNAGVVTSNIIVTVQHSKALELRNSNLSSVGTLDAGSVFSEVDRVITNGGDGVGYNTTVFTFKNKNNLTVEELRANVDEYLKDISFSLDNVAVIAEAGSYYVNVTVDVESSIKFDSKTQKLNFAANASNIVNAIGVEGHHLTVVPAVPATCLENGWTEGVICSTHNSYECDNVIEGALVRPENTIPAINHRYTVVENGAPVEYTYKTVISAVAPGCTTWGVEEHYTCSLCKNDFVSLEDDTIHSHNDFVIPPQHTPVSADPASKDATCTEKGYTAERQVCDVCDAIIIPADIPARGHIGVADESTAVAPTCTETGLTAAIKCDCGLVLVPSLPLAAIGHKMTEWTIVNEATETEEGLMRRSCLNELCDYVEEFIIPLVPHDCVADPDKAEIITEATCTTKGQKQDICGTCGEKIGGVTDIPAKGHNVEEVEEIPATCVAEGVQHHFHCVVCNKDFRDENGKHELKSLTIKKDKKNHGDENIITVPGTPSTCTIKGETGYKKCHNCDIIVEKSSALPLAAHNLVVIAESEADCLQQGIKEHKHCKDCNKDFAMDGVTVIKEKDFVVEALGHDYGEPVKYPEEQIPEDDHYTARKYCTRCDAYISVKMDLTPDNCNHHITLDWVKQDASCTHTGERVKLCMLCGIGIGEAQIIDKTPHNLLRVAAVPSTCYKLGTAAYYECSTCHKLFDGLNPTEEIEEPATLDKLEHNFREQGNGNIKKCTICNEVIHVKKLDKDGNELTDNDISVKPIQNGFKDEKDKDKEDMGAALGTNATVETNIIIEEKVEASKELDDSIISGIADDEEVEKVVWDIDIEKITAYENSVVDREEVVELNDLIEIVIKIPASLRDAVDYLVHRLHADTPEVISTTPNADGECIIINKTNMTVTLKVKKFSEYALVAYDKTVNEEDETPSRPSRPSAGGGGATTVHTIQFRSNGGTSIPNEKVNSGDKVVEPIPTREGYKFAGWYKDASFTEKFDFSVGVTSSAILYAKWVEIGAEDCDGTEAAGCVSLKFNDVDTSLWYHLGIDYVIENGLMVGTSEDEFSPNDNLTRGMLVTILGRKEGIKDYADVDAVFADVSVDEYYASHIEWAVENGIVLGYDDEHFGPEDYLTREDMATIMYRYMTFKGVELTEDAEELAYADVDKIQDYAKEAVTFCFNMGIMQGKDNNRFDPAGKATRAEMATVMMRTFK